MKTKLLSAVLAAICIGALSGCVSKSPRSFSSSQSPSWVLLELREDLQYDDAWGRVVDLVVTQFELDVAMKEEGYLRTEWLYTWSGNYLSNYRVRMTIKFSPDHKNLKFRTEAQYLEDENWVVGTDSRLMSTLKTDLMGTIGRTTR
ncbi:hypothetical protein [Pontiella sulfatireligans]|uniref:DUF3576 domain-containing protein n=1 Tax=Pontiella sulfatireligans TaxID=2750658 RepID=A0A6C2UL77_9BACT|nr:hypothetical protein [Pontiella sulfatireligans]VGO20643.1 hypothetical protein SCARR_02708 [Pontiella sulfatireligans]